MFDTNELERVIDLQEKSYNLFMWLNKKLKEFSPRTKSKKHTLFEEVHEKVSFYKGAYLWIEKHYSELPINTRPDKSDLETFAHLFTSFLTTSFFVSNKIKVSDGCNCPFCTFFVDVTAFQVRNPNKKAIENAQKLKIRYLEQLCRDEKLNDITLNLGDWIQNNPDLYYDIALATYAKELIRRSKYASQGEGILALWREIAWKNNRLDPKFKLKVEKIIAAESKIINILNS
ncbi:MAG: hypothetical protein ACFFBP_22165 [Promethearchaeota archaeon]